MVEVVSLRAQHTRTERVGRGLRWVLRYRLARIASAGAASAVADLALFNLLMLPLEATRTAHVLAANSLAFGGAMLVNYSLNARYSFEVTPTRRSMIAYVMFTAVGLLFYNANLLWLRAVLDATTPLRLNLSKVAAMGLLVAWNYLGYHRFVFGPDARRQAGGGAE